MKRAGWIVAAALVISAAAAPVSAADQEYKLLRLDGRIVKWGAPRLGAPVHVTYAFAKSLLHDSEARNCKTLGHFDALAGRNGLTVAQIEGEAEAAFEAWQNVAGIRFSRTDDPHEADIVIGAQGIPRGYAFANVRYREGADGDGHPASDRGLNAGIAREEVLAGNGEGAVATIEKSAICLNPEHTWKIGRGQEGDGYDLRFTFTHEIGHAIGLDHYARPGQIMHFKYDETLDGPRPGDVVGLRRLYGPPSAVAR